MIRRHIAKYLTASIQHKRGVRVWWTWKWGWFFWRKVMANVSMNTTQQFTISVTPVDASGNPGTIDAPPTYPVDTAGICTIVPSADGLSCLVQGEAVGTCNIAPTALSGGNPIVGPVVSVTVTAPPELPATQLLVSVSPVTQQ